MTNAEKFIEGIKIISSYDKNMEISADKSILFQINGAMRKKDLITLESYGFENHYSAFNDSTLLIYL